MSLPLFSGSCVIPGEGPHKWPWELRARLNLIESKQCGLMSLLCQQQSAYLFLSLGQAFLSSLPPKPGLDHTGALTK